MRYQTRGRDPESGQDVTVELGYDAATGYWYGVDQGERELASGVEIASVPELVARTRQYGIWTRQVYQAMRDAPTRDYMERHPADPTTKILAAVK